MPKAKQDKVPILVNESTLKRYIDLQVKQKPIKYEMERIYDAVKNYLIGGNYENAEFGEWEASLGKATPVMNEERLIARLKAFGLSEAIVTVEKVDANVLQRLLYEKKLTENDLATCLDDLPQSSRRLYIRKRRLTPNAGTETVTN